ncbi:thymidylate kinase [Gregarina niphandrodes]|uniref:dTMP kinase n=1 Tax=Gregarina niphandrodes TaxID=110365 RepID=A0A023B8L3_GRENI|nr:thymidylate kinase [Gregarina niphandrodes]EZG69393.1 thymidylate kinase [Gregarina niphandrodes]|eukprot:XP_011130014.1 thymidylate kinase [Gregarina niphandrodes]
MAQENINVTNDSKKLRTCKEDQGERRRGRFIVIEGLDKSGKSTQSSRLAEWLRIEHGLEVISMCFPDRTTEIGHCIDQYLKSKSDISHKAAHLLYSANRWEKQTNIRQALEDGKMVVCDRYAFSGIAYTHGIFNESLSWCMYPDEGLLAPDLVIFLESDPNRNMATRLESGQKERYEDADKQQKVGEAFRAFYGSPGWHTVATGGQSIEQVHEKIKSLVTPIVVRCEHTKACVSNTGKVVELDLPEGLDESWHFLNFV